MTIVCGTDLSDNANQAVNAAFALARLRHDRELVITHVLATDASDHGEDADDDMPEPPRDRRDRLPEVLLVGQPLEPGTRRVRPGPIELPDEFARPVDVVARRPLRPRLRR